jgi:hypothetical protein
MIIVIGLCNHVVDENDEVEVMYRFFNSEAEFLDEVRRVMDIRNNPGSEAEFAELSWLLDGQAVEVPTKV